MEKNTIVGIIIGIIIAVVIIGAAVYFTGDSEPQPINMTDSNNTTSTVNVTKVIKSDNVITDAAYISSVKVVENGQDGGYMVEITYKNGHFRQYDAETGKFIGSDLNQDAKYFDTSDFD